jgi:hypothetical protein
MRLIDLLVLEHVLEHFVDPVSEMNRILKKVKPNKYLIVEIPNLIDIANSDRNPITYFQNAHTFCFYQQYLEIFFHKLGLDVLYADETCSFVLRRPASWREVQPKLKIESPELEACVPTVESYLKYAHVKWNAK